MKAECDIIKDLIPLYVEDLTSEASSQLIKNHLHSCEDCAKYLHSIESDLPNGGQLGIEEEKGDQKLIQGVKRKIFKMKFIAILIGSAIGLSLSLAFFNLALAGAAAFLLLIVILIYLFKDEKHTKGDLM
jgi:hypothetical protein